MCEENQYGANSFIIGDYLTTSSEKVKKNLFALENLDYKLASL